MLKALGEIPSTVTKQKIEKRKEKKEHSKSHFWQYKNKEM
jgi:hypothetical protein